MKISPPQSEEELLSRAEKLTGKTLQHIATLLERPVPADQSRHKGWVGTLLEQFLGASANSLSEPDFQQIGIELKSLPVNSQGKPRESTYVCTVPLTPDALGDWESSAVQRKLSRVLWVPVEADPAIPLAQRHIGTALLWSPNETQQQQLQSDWEELTNMIALGELEQITTSHGQILQIRPKAADARSLSKSVNAEGEMSLTLPRGFYLRTTFTAKVLNQITDSHQVKR